jgi:hypothetical protein
MRLSGRRTRTEESFYAGAHEEDDMSNYTLAQFSDDLGTLLKAGGVEALPRVEEKLRLLLANPEFVAATWDETTPPGKRVLHHDPETDVYVLAHVHQGTGIPGVPHTHGTSWAVYGNAKGFTDMSIWRRVNPESEERAELARVEEYRLDEGQARSYASGAIHSTLQVEKAWVIRVTGTDLDVLPRFRFRPDRDRIVEVPVAG